MNKNPSNVNSFSIVPRRCFKEAIARDIQNFQMIFIFLHNICHAFLTDAAVKFVRMYSTRGSIYLISFSKERKT